LANHRLLLSNKTREDLICGQELQHYLGENAVFTYTRESSSPFASRRIDLALLRDHVDRLDQYFYVCGPDPFVTSMREALTALGVDPGRLVYEQ
jgi:cytochrome-b5 reductase